MMGGLLFVAIVVVATLSARWNWWRMPRRGIPILMYHKVGNPPLGSKLKKLWVSRQRFEAQLSYLSNHGYQPITFKDLYQHWDVGRALPAKPILITFDDGYENNFTDAFPILQKFGFPATIFVVANTVDGVNVWHDPNSEVRIRMVSWAQLTELQKAGWEIGSHTMNHRNLDHISLEEVQKELEESRRVIGDRLGEMPQTFAYPYGSGQDNEAVRSRTKNAGYRAAVTIHAGKWPVDRLRREPYFLPRIFVRGDESLFDFQLQVTRGRNRF